MSFFVTEKCIKCKYTDCVEVCPVECFHEGPNMLAINPDECIDCALCEPECPIGAIVSEHDDSLKAYDRKFLDINNRLSKIWPLITVSKKGLINADQWREVNNKYKYLIE